MEKRSPSLQWRETRMAFVSTLFSTLTSFFNLQMPKWTLCYSRDLIKAKLEWRMTLHLLQMVVSFIWSGRALPFSCILVSGLLVRKIHTDAALQICTNCQFTLAHLSLRCVYSNSHATSCPACESKKGYHCKWYQAWKWSFAVEGQW